MRFNIIKKEMPMASSTSKGSGGIGFFGLLTIVFVVAKLWGKITWSWWWILAPMWIPFVIAFGALIIFGLIWFIAALVNHTL